MKGMFAETFFVTIQRADFIMDRTEREDLWRSY